MPDISGRKYKDELLSKFKFCPMCGGKLIDSKNVPDAKECETHGIGVINIEGNAISGYRIMGYTFTVY